MFNFYFVLAIFAFLATSPAPVRAEVVNRIIATVDGDPLTDYEMRQFQVNNIRARQIPPNEKAALLDFLITEHIIQKEISAKGILIRDEDVARYVDGVREQNKLDEAGLREALKQQGLTLDQYRAQVRDDLQKSQLINREIRGKVTITPEEVERYYQANLGEATTDAQVTLSHIVFRLPEGATDEQAAEARQRADDVYTQLRNGAPFAVMASKYSEDAAAQSGGKLGKFGKGEMLDEFEVEVEKLKPGEFSTPFRTKVGIHIIRVDERTASGHETLESLAQEIKDKLYAAALEERYTRWLREDLRAQHHIEMLP